MSHGDRRARASSWVRCGNRFALGLLIAAGALRAAAPSCSVNDYGLIQEALDRNPGRMLYVPPGDHTVAKAIRLRTEHGGLLGPGRIVYTNSEAGIITVQDAADVQVRDLTLTRAAGKENTDRAAVAATQAVHNCGPGILHPGNYALHSRIGPSRGDRCGMPQLVPPYYSDRR